MLRSMGLEEFGLLMLTAANGQINKIPEEMTNLDSIQAGKTLSSQKELGNWTLYI